MRYTGTKCVTRFLEFIPVARDETLRKRLSRELHIPLRLWEFHYQESNGFSGSSTTYDEEQKPTGYGCQCPSVFRVYMLTCLLVTWFKFIVKQLKAGSGGQEYDWHEMTFIVSYLSKSMVVLCFNTAPELRAGLRNHLVGSRANLTNKIQAIYALQQLLVDEVVKRYDSSVWQIRHVVRDVEKVCPMSGSMLSA